MTSRLLSLLSVLFTLAAGHAAAAPELLPADQAFRVSGRLAGDGMVLVRLRAAAGYYLYRDKLRFAAEPATVTLDTPPLPAGQELQDEFFGKVRVYRGETEVRLAARLPSGASGFTLVVRSQGCADAGVCYTPQEQRLVLSRGRPDAGPASPPGASLVDQLRESAPPGR
jgi:thiol:disulfide interchange protein DsbD